MSKAITGAVELAGAAALDATALLTTGGIAAIFQPIFFSLLSAGIASEAGAIASAIGSKAGLGITTRTPAALRQIVRGVQRVGGTIVYCSTTGSTNRQYNMIIALASHPCYAIENVYLDGRQVFWDTSSSYNQTVNGYNFGGNADGNNHTGPNGDQYNFGGLVFCAAFYGNQNSNPTVVGGTWVGAGNPAGFCSALQANDSTWSPANVVVGATAEGGCSFNSGGTGEIDLLNLTFGGDGYADTTSGYLTITDLGGTGSGAAGHYVASGRVVTELVLDSPGANYTNPQVTIAPPATIENTPYLAGVTYVYLKIEANAGTFPQFPEIRFTVHGKSNIYDPRTETSGFTTNWALHVADVIADPTWGLGDGPISSWPSAAVDQLIAAANVCDELTGCAAGSEAQYALNMQYDTSSGAGDVLERMMPAAAGRLSRIGGGWYIWPAYWQGPSFTFDENSLLDTVQWDGKRPISDLCNRITGTYIAPNFPYNIAGNLYDSNGYFNGATQNNFPFGFQPTNYPMYACDELHGYDEDVYLVADTPNQGAYSSATAYAAGATVIYGGVPWTALQATTGNTPAAGSAYWAPSGVYLPQEISQDCILSISQAQRVAKIMLLRNRQQGSGTFTMSAAALAMQPTDVMQFSLSVMGWTNKLLEIAGGRGQKLKVRYAVPPGANADGQDQAPALFVEVPVNETDPSVYEWDDDTEELTPYDVPAFTGASQIYTVGPPTSASATSNLSTALVQPNGTVTPRIELTWTEPTDTYVANGGSIQIQMCAHLSAAWQDVLLLGGQATVAFLGAVVTGSSYDVRLRSLRPSGAASAWVEIDNVICGVAITATGLSAVAPAGTLQAMTTSPTASSIVVLPFTASAAGFTVSCLPGGSVVLTGESPQYLYYVYYIDPTFTGGAITPIATLNAADFVGKPGYFLIGSILTPAYASARYAPGSSMSLGTVGVQNGANASDGNLATYALLFGIINEAWPSGGWCEGLWTGFPSIAATSGQNLYLNAQAIAIYSGSTAPWAMTASIGGGAKPSGQLGALNSRGAWGATTAYALWDTFTEGGVTYLVVTGYTSGSTFGSTDATNTCVLLASGTGSAAQATYSVLLPPGLNLSVVSVDLTVNVEPGTSADTYLTQLLAYEIYVQ